MSAPARKKSPRKPEKAPKPRRGPQGVYVDEVIHTRTARFVENALDGHGTLGGFIAYLEDVLLSVQADVNVNANRTFRSIDTASIDAQRDPIQKAYRTLRDAPRDRQKYQDGLERYASAWTKLGKWLPWKLDSAEAHLFGLFLLRNDGGLWTQDGAYDPSQGASHGLEHLYDLKVALERYLNISTQASGRVRSDAASTYDNPYFKPFPVIWRGDKVELIFGDVKSKSTSFYVDPEAHRIAVQAFGRDAFARIERGLHRIFQDRSLWLPLEPEFRFLEHGSMLFEYEPPIWFSEPESVDEELEANSDVSYPAFLREQALHFGDVFPDVYRFGGFSWDAAAYAGEYSGVIDARAAVVTALFPALRLAFRLGLADPAAENLDSESYAREILPAFLRRFGLEDLLPTRAHAYRVIRAYEGATVDTLTTNAVDFHILQLLKAYASSVLPSGQREPERIAASTLATLAQPWVFPTRETLEVYTNTRAEKAEHGIWRLMKGGKSVLELQDEDAYAAARTLNAILTTQPSYTLTLEAADEIWHDTIWGRTYHDRRKHGWRLAKYVEDAVEAAGIGDQRLLLPASADLAAMTLDVIHATAPSPSSTEPTVVGAVVVATLLDESAGTEEAIFEQLVERLPVDVTTVRLTRRQRASVLHLLDEIRGHRPAGIGRWRGRSGDQIWAYEWEGTRHELAADLAGSVAGLLNEMFEAAGPAVRTRVAEAMGVMADGNLGRTVVDRARYVPTTPPAYVEPAGAIDLGTHMRNTMARVEAALGEYPVVVEALRTLIGTGR